jgi:hypothetical protein
LNFSGSGISASFGVRGASVTVGKRGTYLDVGLPGSGLSYRTRLDKPKAGKPGRQALPVDPIVPERRPSPFDIDAEDAMVDGLTYTGKRVYISEHPDSLSSSHLQGLADLASEAEARRAKIRSAKRICEGKLSWARAWLAIGRFFIFRPFFTKKRIDNLAAAIQQLGEAQAELEELLEAAVIDVDFGFGEATKSRYRQMVDAYGAVSRSDRIWDIPTSYDVNRYATRSAASESLKLKPVKFAVEPIEEFGSEFPAMRFGNVNGPDLFLMPGFLALRRPSGGLALIDMKDLSVDIAPTQFIEQGRRPSDADQVGEAWAKSNKDGSRDKRFKGNYAIPVMLYGGIRVSSRTGLNERFMVTNWKALNAFKAALTAYQKALGAERSAETGGSQVVPFDQILDLVLPDLKRTPWLVGFATVLRTSLAAGLVLIAIALTNGASLDRFLPNHTVTAASPVTPGTSAVNQSGHVEQADVETTPNTESEINSVIEGVLSGKAGTNGVEGQGSKPAKTQVAPSTKASSQTQTAKAGQPTASSESEKTASTTESLTKAEVTRLQEKLQGLGYYSGPTDGRLTAATIASFNQWKSETGKAAVQIITRADLQAFEKAISR